METQKTTNIQSNLEKEWNWRKQSSWLQTILQSDSHQDSMVLAQKQKYRPMEQDRKPVDKPMQLWATYLWQRRQEHAVEEWQSLQFPVFLETLNNYMEKAEVRTLPHTIHKNKLKMD